MVLLALLVAACGSTPPIVDGSTPPVVDGPKRYEEETEEPTCNQGYTADDERLASRLVPAGSSRLEPLRRGIDVSVTGDAIRFESELVGQAAELRGRPRAAQRLQTELAMKALEWRRRYSSGGGDT